MSDLCRKCGNAPKNTRIKSNRGLCKQCLREIDRERLREWRAKNADRDREQNHKRYLEKKESIKEYMQKWGRENKELAVAYVQKRRAKKKGNGGSYTVNEWESLCKQYDYRCLSCGRDGVKLTVDHVLPLELGGSNDISNIQPLCGSCNSRKSKRHIDYRTKPGIIGWIQCKLLG